MVSTNPLQAALEVFRGEDPDAVCRRHNLSRDELNGQIEAHQQSMRQRALAEEFSSNRVGRNEPCPCGSGKKYKKCCLARYEEARQSIPLEEVLQMEERTKRQESLEKDIRKGFDLLFSKDYDKARKLAMNLLREFPEDDRVHDIVVNACMATGEYDEAFRICRRRWQVAVEEKEFLEANGHHKREGADRKELVHFFSPSAWLVSFWMTQRARTYRDQFPVGQDTDLLKLVDKLRLANDPNRFPSRREDGFEVRKKALQPVLDEIEKAGVTAIPYLLPLTFSFSWASLFVPDLLAAYGTDDCVRLLAELSMSRFPFFAQRCLMNLEGMGPRVIPEVEGVLQRDSAFDELKVGLISLLGHLPSPASFAILTRWIDHENPFVLKCVVEAMGCHETPEALPYLEKANARLSELSQIAGAIRELGVEQEHAE
jgi:hypothetical protein